MSARGLLGRRLVLWLCAAAVAGTGLEAPASAASPAPRRKTSVSIVGDQFFINGRPTYEGRTWRGHRIEGLLMNARMVQAIFDDLNPQTVSRWAYPDTGRWDAERNTREFLAAMPEWRRHGLLAFTVNLQGGSPQGYSRDQPWHNSAINADGSLRPDYLNRLGRVLDRADDLGMVVILGLFYFGQDQRLRDEAAVIRATDEAVGWVLQRGYRNVLIEVNNECNVRYDHPILQPARVHELILRVRDRVEGGRRLYVGTSYGGGTIPGENVVRVSDFLLLHGNGVADPGRIADMVRRTRAVPGYFSQPILFNEDDHFDFDKPSNNMLAAVGEYASWGYFDFRMAGEGFQEGYQSVPVDWRTSSARKRGFFSLLAQVTGANPEAAASTGATITRAGAVMMHTHRGWPGSYVLRNREVEAVVVPAVGRVMQFGFKGRPGVFWENADLVGQPADPEAPEWINFGGDKAWPAPEGEWSRVTGAARWKPPAAFDGMAWTARRDGDAVIMTSPEDPAYGVRVERRVELDPKEPVMRIATTFERVRGEPLRLSVWVVTQLNHPEAVFAETGREATRPGHHVVLGKEVPPSLTVQDGLAGLIRDPGQAYKIGAGGGRLVWVGREAVLRIDSERVHGADYPDRGSSVEIYTNPDPLTYIELETLGPLQTMRPGDRLTRTNVYRLFKRSRLEPEAEARRVLKR